MAENSIRSSVSIKITRSRASSSKQIDTYLSQKGNQALLPFWNSVESISYLTVPTLHLARKTITPFLQSVKDNGLPVDFWSRVEWQSISTTLFPGRTSSGYIFGSV